MKRVLSFGLLSAAIVGFSALGASAAPLTPPSAPVEAASQAQEVGGRRHYRRHHHRYHRRHYGRHHHHYYRPRAYYGPRYYSYRPYYRDYYYGAPYVGIGLPFINLHIGGHRHRHHW
jgi:hypothetical protein